MTGRVRLLLGIALGVLCFGPARVVAAPILITHGDTIVDYGDVPAQEDTVGHTYTKGAFKESYFGIFWINLWTWGGEWCCYDGGTRYISESKAEMAALLHKSEADLKPPFFYRFPLGWLVIGTVLIFVVLSAIFGNNGPTKVAVGPKIASKPMPSAQPQAAGFAAGPPPIPASPVDARAAEIYRQTLGAGDASQARADAAFEAGVAHLVANGVPRDAAIDRLLNEIQAATGV